MPLRCCDMRLLAAAHCCPIGLLVSHASSVGPPTSGDFNWHYKHGMPLPAGRVDVCSELTRDAGQTWSSLARLGKDYGRVSAPARLDRVCAKLQSFRPIQVRSCCVVQGTRSGTAARACCTPATAAATAQPGMCQGAAPRVLLAALERSAQSVSATSRHVHACLPLLQRPQIDNSTGSQPMKGAVRLRRTKARRGQPQEIPAYASDHRGM